MTACVNRRNEAGSEVDGIVLPDEASGIAVLPKAPASFNDCTVKYL